MASPDFPPLLLEQSDTPPQRISPTDVSQFIRLDQCQRYLRLRLHERTYGQRFMLDYGVAPQAIPPLLTLAGQRFEEQVEVAASRHVGSAINCRMAAQAGDDAFVGADHNALILARTAALTPGTRTLLFQPRLRVTLGHWDLRGDLDILLLERNLAGDLQLLIADVKSSTASRVEHHLQVAFYHEMLAALFAAAGQPVATITTGILYRGPAPGARALTPVEQVRLDAQGEAALSLFGLEGAFFDQAALPDAYREEVRSLVIAPGSVAAEVAHAPFEALPFHLTYKCDGCLYNELCMKWAAEQDDLSLIPYLSDTEKGALRTSGITTTRALATLKEFANATTNDLVTAPEQQALVYELSKNRMLGPRLDELVHRARRYRHWRGDDLRALSYIPSKGYGTLPAVNEELHPNLVRVYLDVQHDYLQDRVYLLGALVTACTAGREDPEQRQSIVHMADEPPGDPAQEQMLLTQWVAAVISTVVTLATPDPEGQRRAPIHLIFNDRFTQGLLLDALARHFGAVVGSTPLYDFITQLASFDSPLVTLLEQERCELKNDPMVCTSLQALAHNQRFDWGIYREIFRARMFDDIGRLDESMEGPAAWYTRRARFNSQIPLEYAYAAWEELPPPPTAGRDDLASYRRATPALLHGFQARRLEAMEQLTLDFKGNRQTKKSSFDLPDLATFEQTARNLADALHEFLTLERHTALSTWKHVRLAPPERRVLAGVSLIVCYDEADQTPTFLEVLAENERRSAQKKELEAVFFAANPTRKRMTLTPAQREATKLQELPPYRLRIVMDGVECDLATALNLTSFAPGDRIVLAPRWDVDDRLPPEQQQPFTPTAKQLFYQPRARLVTLDPAGFIEVKAERGGNGDGRYTFGYGWHPLIPGGTYTIESDPNDIYGQRCEEIVRGLQRGAPNRLYERLVDPTTERVTWPSEAIRGQARFAAGLEALQGAGLLHPFDTNQQRYIASLGDTPTLLVQGPPGTGKSYATAFALLARLQGALAAGQSFRVLLTCKTHAATEVLLEKIAEVQALMRRIRAEQPALFHAHFDPRICDLPLFRVDPRDPTRTWPGPVTILTSDVALGELTQQRAYVAAITPFATSKICKGPGGYFDQTFCDCLILDEASQMNLPEAVMAALPLRQNGQLIVVGDHRQMPPIVQHDWGDERRRTFQLYRSYSSLFEALLLHQPPPPMVKFTESFRLHRDIAHFLREAIYLQDGIDYHSQQLATLAPIVHGDPFLDAVLAPEHPLVVVIHEEARSQILNPYELRLVQPILRALAELHGLDAAQGLGVVVPHRAQRAALKATLPEIMDALLEGGLDDSAVDTVERFQGGERTAILVSATESDRDYLRVAGEFLLDPRRLNVALSRAKQKLILVASRSIFTIFHPDEEIFAHTQLWKGLLRRTCTVQLWTGEREGVPVTVWGNGTAWGNDQAVDMREGR